MENEQEEIELDVDLGEQDGIYLPDVEEEVQVEEETMLKTKILQKQMWMKKKKA